VISLPKDWATTKDSNDSLSSIVSGDTTLLKKGVILTLSVTEQRLVDNNLKSAFHAELLGMERDSSLSILTKGSFKTIKYKGYWVEVNEDSKNHSSVLKNLVMYFSDSRKQKLYISQFTYSDQSEFEKQACRIFQLLKTFNSFRSEEKTHLAHNK
jgi:hypothetical protein